MGSTKALGYDGFPVIFYQCFWYLIGKDVTHFYLKALNRELPLEEVNFTKIVLIPKTSAANSMSSCHPISLCSVLYKVISKVLANRLRIVLEDCIDEAQGAFVPRRLISDNVLVAYELMHTLKKKRLGKKGSFALKLDMSKAYDRVEWGFIECMMLRMEFDARWVELIMHSISSVSYSVMVNDGISEILYLNRGLR
ncbi:uncharacterized protein [Gossypium hirsutum]|uniref:Reverse transcriptase domain-containing protein n=1 Tax=Gossypium hirsutum TaxID=3635 RepID=A0A1U8KCC0_GOSHI|nr:uncharacterized protein LOC107915498 [Gossypium hirsutum]